MSATRRGFIGRCVSALGLAAISPTLRASPVNRERTYTREELLRRLNDSRDAFIRLLDEDRKHRHGSLYGLHCVWDKLSTNSGAPGYLNAIKSRMRRGDEMLILIVGNEPTFGKLMEVFWFSHEAREDTAIQLVCCDRDDESMRRFAIELWGDLAKFASNPDAKLPLRDIFIQEGGLAR